MIGPVCSLHPSGGGWEPEGAAGGRHPTAAAAVLALSVLGLLAVLAWIGSVAARPVADRADAAERAGLAGPPVEVPPAPGGEPSAVEQFQGSEPFEATVDHRGGLVLVRVVHRGDGPFALDVRDGAGVVPGEASLAGTPLVDVAGPYQGSRAFGLPEGSYAWRVGVQGGGEWGLAVEQPRYAAHLRLPGTLHGVGDTATRPFEVTTDRTVRMSWTVEHASGVAAGDSRLHVRVLDLSGAVAAELEAGHGDELDHDLPAGHYLLDVTTGAGVWRVLLS